MAVRFLQVTLAMTMLFLAGCETAERFSQGNPQLVASPDPVSARLAEAADRASKALQTLAAVENAKLPSTPVPPVHNPPVELSRAISVNWIGPVEPITQSLADRASYHFNILGSPPATPLVVNINVENQPIIDVMRDIGLQLGLRANIKVDAQNQVVEIHYAPTMSGAINAAKP